MEKTGRERLIDTLNHRDPGKVVVDIGSTAVTGIHIDPLARLTSALGMEERPLYLDEPLQQLGRVEEGIGDLIGSDVAGVSNGNTIFGFRNRNWRETVLKSGQRALIPEEYRTTQDEKGNTYIYAGGDLSCPPAGVMPKRGCFFDNITRSAACADDDDLDARADYKEDFGILNDEQLRLIEERVKFLWENTDRGMIYNGALCGIGDFALVPGPHVKHPEGIRDLEEFMMAHFTAPDYIHEMFEMQLEAGIRNAELLYQAAGDKLQAVYVSGTDFGLQNGPYMSQESFRTFYKPVYTRMNAWIHEHTGWKTFFHSCGSVVTFLEDFAEAGVDILNPVQISAKGMDPAALKKEWGDRLVFWGGGINTQQTLPFGTPEECYEETLRNLKIFAPGGGYVFSAVHNIQNGTPTENMLAMMKAVRDYNSSLQA